MPSPRTSQSKLKVLRPEQRKTPLSKGSLRWDIVRSLLSLRALAGPWGALIRPGQESIGPEYVLSWFETMGNAAEPFVLVARDNVGQVTGLLALAEGPTGRLVMAGAAQGGEHGDVVAIPGQGARIAQGALGALRSYPWTHLTFTRLAAQGHLARALDSQKRPGPYHNRTSAVVPRVTGLTTWREFLTTRKKKVRHEIRRHLRRFEAIEGAQIRWVETDDDLDEHIDTLFRLHASRFKSQRKRTQFTGFHQRVFHKKLARRLAKQGRLLLVFLEVRGTPIAAAYGWHRGDTTTLFQMGFDPNYAHLSPGYVLASILLRDGVIERGRTTLDLGEGCYPWKLRWANSVADLRDIDVFRNSISGRVGSAKTNTVARTRGWLRRRVKHIGCNGLAGDVRPSEKLCASTGCTACPVWKGKKTTP